MADDDSLRAAEVEFIEALYGDPIRLATAKAGRNLLIAGLLLIAVVKFGAQIQASSLFPITFKRPDVLPTVLAVLVGVLLANFLVRAAMDVGLFIEGEQRISGFVWRTRTEDAAASARQMDNEMDLNDQEEYGHPNADPWWEEFGKIQDAAKAAEEALEKRLGRTTVMRFVRVSWAGGGVLIPIAAAAVSLLISYPKWQWPS